MPTEVTQIPLSPASQSVVEQAALALAKSGKQRVVMATNSSEISFIDTRLPFLIESNKIIDYPGHDGFWFYDPNLDNIFIVLQKKDA